MIALSGELVDWAREALAAGDEPAEVAGECGVSEEQLLLACQVRRPMNARCREAMSFYAAGFGFKEIDVALGLPASSHGGNSWGMIERARAAGYAIEKRRSTSRLRGDQRFDHDLQVGA